MITKIVGRLEEVKEQSVIVSNQGLFYEIFVPVSVLQRLEDTKDEKGNIRLVLYHYFQIGPSGGAPFLIGFTNEIERDFFLQFIKVSGIGPRAAVKALAKPISEIAEAIDAGDIKYLKTLPGIGEQKAKEIIAKLQNKMGRFGLIQDKGVEKKVSAKQDDWEYEALQVLLQLQYKKQEAAEMIKSAKEQCPGLHSAEDLLNEIYKQKVNVPSNI